MPDLDIAARGHDRVTAEPHIVSAGKIHMLDLDAIKARLGSKWERMSELVHRYFEAAIRREMQPGDTFYHSGELSYLVMFRDLTIAETQLKCAVVVEDVCRRLFGEQQEAIRVRNLVAPMDAVELTGVRERLRVDRALERDGREVLFQGVGGAVDVRTEPVLPVRLGPAATAVHTVARRKPSFLYRPLWDTSHGVVLTYICQILPDTVKAGAAFAAPGVASDGEDDQSVLDTLALRECMQRAGHLRQAGLRVLLAAPLHFDTLCRPRFWSQYGALAAAAPAGLFRDLAFLVHGFDAGTPNIRLVHEIPKLSRFSRHIFCLAEDRETARSSFRNTGIHALGIALQPGRSERHGIDRMNAVVREARDNGVDAFVLGAASRSAAVNAVGAGVRYIEGPAVRPAVADPRHAFAHGIEDLYRDMRGPASDAASAALAAAS